jgi:glycosyltransferase involved in cell wall biosynthesis
MTHPIVSFVVPCYNLGHLLPECVASILAQTYNDFEVLIMDDCSPDNTNDVARSFGDPRVRHIRNDNNIGHLRNYNKGIELSRGKYIWLISADDRLRRSYALERYVQLMEAHPQVGYVFCPGVGLQDGAETGILTDYYYGSSDRVFEGREFISTVLRKGGGLLSPSVMVRRDCYQHISMFPLDMPHQGDMYLWFVWALDYDVAYLSEPMVNYRSHDLNMMKDLMSRVPDIVFTDEMNVLWRIRRKAEEKGFRVLRQQVEDLITRKYANAAAFCCSGGDDRSVWPISIRQCVDALRANTSTSVEYKRLLGTFYAHIGDKHWMYTAFQSARSNYGLALRENWRMPMAWLKLLLASTGRTGIVLRRFAKVLVTSWQPWRSYRKGSGILRRVHG